MIEPNLKDAIVIVHSQLTAVPDECIERAIAPASFGVRTRVERINVRQLALGDLPELDWGSAHDALIAEIERIRPVLEGSNGPLLYFGMAPIPLTMELGNRIANTRRALVFQQRHDNKEWRWEATDASVTATLDGKPGMVCRAKGDVVVRVACSHPVAAEDTRRVVPHAIGELDVLVAGPHEDVLKSEADVAEVATRFGEALDCVRHFYPNCETIHVFAAVPAGLAFRLGAEINPNVHRPVQTYQFCGRENPKYRPALVVGERVRRHLTPDELTAADRAREIFSRALTQLTEWIGSRGPSPAMPAPATARSGLGGALAHLGPMTASPSIVSASVATDIREADGEFRWDPAKRIWIFDDALLSALAARLTDTALEQAARLFFLHETAHIDGQGLTTATAEGVGRLPRILEGADYAADVWAIQQELARAIESGETNHERAAEHVRNLVAVMTATVWSFDAADLPLRAIQVRRLNRYLIWYWQRLRLERADTVSDAHDVLMSKPVLEISGPRVSTSRGRVLFDLDPTYFDDVEFGALVDGVRIQRIGARAGAHAGRLLGALRAGDHEAFIAILRGIFDTVET